MVAVKAVVPLHLRLLVGAEVVAVAVLAVKAAAVVVAVVGGPGCEASPMRWARRPYRATV